MKSTFIESLNLSKTQKAIFDYLQNLEPGYSVTYKNIKRKTGIPLFTIKQEIHYLLKLGIAERTPTVSESTGLLTGTGVSVNRQYISQQIKQIADEKKIRDEMDADMEQSGMAQGEIESCLNHWFKKYKITRR